ncbi:hypothetical protein [Xanthobacter autotrophicus]|uniref:hypothetical protein n=1 Tax=Xanthobacter autotrophicus TaxID=280 RepID=UPI003729716D
MQFKDREDVEEWLEPLDYEAFWEETAPFVLALEPRASCDAQIASGSIDRMTVLAVLKGMARLELVERFQLPIRDDRPWRTYH